jgi:hypothetical protein
MVILVADHQVIVAAELKISLPQTIAVFPLETFGSPSLSRLSYRMIQAGFADNLVNLVVINNEAFVFKVTGYFVWTPIVPFSYLDDFLFQETVKFRTTWTTSWLFFKSLLAFSLVPIPPVIEYFSANLCLSTNRRNTHTF